MFYGKAFVKELNIYKNCATWIFDVYPNYRFGNDTHYRVILVVHTRRNCAIWMYYSEWSLILLSILNSGNSTLRARAPVRGLIIQHSNLTLPSVYAKCNTHTHIHILIAIILLLDTFTSKSNKLIFVKFLITDWDTKEEKETWYSSCNSRYD